MADDFNPLDFATDDVVEQPGAGQAPAGQPKPRTVTTAPADSGNAESDLAAILGGGDLTGAGLDSYDDGQGQGDQPRGPDGKFATRDAAPIDEDAVKSAAALMGGEVEGEGEGEEGDEFDALFKTPKEDLAAAGADGEGLVDVGDGHKVKLDDLKEAYNLIQDHEVIAQELAHRETGLNHLQGILQDRLELIQTSEIALAGILRSFIEIDEASYGDTPEEGVRYRNDVARAKKAQSILQAAAQHVEKAKTGHNTARSETLKVEQQKADLAYANHVRKTYPQVVGNPQRMAVFQQRIYDVCAEFGVDKAAVDANRDPLLLDIAVALAQAGRGRKLPQGTKGQPGGRQPAAKPAPTGSKTAAPGKPDRKIDPRRIREDLAQMRSGSDEAAMRLMGSVLASGGLANR